MDNPHAPFPKDWPARPKAMGGDPFLCLMGGNKTSFWRDDAELKAPFEIPHFGEAMVRSYWQKEGTEFVETFGVIFAGVGVGVSGAATIEEAQEWALFKYSESESRDSFFEALASLAKKKTNKRYPPYGRVLPQRHGEERVED